MERRWRDYGLGGVGALMEFLGVVRGPSWLAWLACFFFILAFWDFTSPWLSKRGKLARIGLPAFGVIILVVATGLMIGMIEKNRYGAQKVEAPKSGGGAPSPNRLGAATGHAQIGAQVAPRAVRPPQGAGGKPLAASARKPSRAVGTRILHKSQAQGPRTSSNRLAASTASVKQPPAAQKESLARQPSPREAQISAYSELKNVIEAVNNASKDWANGVEMCQDTHDMWLANVEGPGEPPTQSDRTRASVRYALCMKGVEDGFRAEDSTPIRAAVEDAIARMQLPGSEQITPNQALAIRQEFKDALTKSQALPSLENPAPEASDVRRFKPLLDFLTRLLNQLGNYPENP